MAVAQGYSDGTISIANGATTAVGIGTNFLQWVTPGYPLFLAGQVVPVLSVTDNTHFEIALPWPGTNQVNASYFILYLTTTQLDLSQWYINVRTLVATLAGATIMIQVPDTQSAPDNALGQNGWWAIKLFDDGGAWKFWKKKLGVWVFVGTPIGIQMRGFWSGATDGTADYLANDIVSRLGVLYYALLPNTNKPPESNPTYWRTLLAGGNRYDIAFDASDRPDSGEVFRRMVFTTPVQFIAGMTDSRANALTPATATAVLSIRKNNVEFGTLTFNAAANVGVFASAAGATFAAGDILTIVAPNPRDATLATLAITLTGYR